MASVASVIACQHGHFAHSKSGEQLERSHPESDNAEVRDNPGRHRPRDCHTEFAASAAVHINDVVHRLTVEHERLIASLWKENQELQASLIAAKASTTIKGKVQHQVVDLDAGLTNTEDDKPAPVCDTKLSLQKSERALGAAASSHTYHTNRVSLDFEKELEQSPICEGVRMASVVSFGQTPSTRSDTLGELPAMSGWRYWKRRTDKWIRNGKFDSFVGAVIVSNTLVMSLQLEYTGRVFEDEVINSCSDCRARSPAIETFFTVMEHAFTAIFAIELAIRLFVEGVRYLMSVSNLFDGIIVVVSMADSWLLGPLGSDVLGSVAVLRLMRLLRLAKILRVVRVMKAFRSLRVLVAAVMNSVGALAWSMTLLFVLELCGAIFMAQVIQPFMEETNDDALRKYIWQHFGTWTNSMFTIFEITMAPGGFIQYRRLYEEVHPLFGIFCISYVCLVTFAVVRVITAMFLKATLSASDSDEQASACEKTKELASFVRSMEYKTDNDGTRTISRHDVEHLLEVDHFSEWIEDAGVTSREVLRIFASLDAGTHEVSFSEFEAALRQIRGGPRAADLVTNLNLTRNMMLRILRMQNILEQRFTSTMSKHTHPCDSEDVKSSRDKNEEDLHHVATAI